MEFVKKKVNMDILGPFNHQPRKKGQTHSNKSSAKTAKTDNCMCVLECVYIFLIKIFK